MSQEDDAGDLRRIVCRSKKLKPSELNYPVHEKEAYALVDAMKHWRHYLLGAKVCVHTDNFVRSYIQRAKKPSTCQVQWLETIQEYNLTIKHIP